MSEAEADTTEQPPTSDADEAIRLVASAETLTGVLEPVESLVEECRLRVGPEGLSLRATDAAKAALVVVTAEPAAFESYRAGGESNASEVTVGVNVERLADVVGLADGLVTLQLDPTSRSLRVTADGVSFRTSVLAPERVREVPDRAALEAEFDYDATFGLPAAGFSRAVRASEMVTDHLVVRGESSGVRFDADGDTDECTVQFDAETLVEPDLGPAESILSLDYLRIVERVVPSDTSLSVAAGTNTPLAVEYDLPDGGRAEWLISPRISR